MRNRFPGQWSDKKDIGISAGDSFMAGLLEEPEDRITVDVTPKIGTEEGD